MKIIKEKKIDEKIQELFNSEITYSKVLSQDINAFMEMTKEYVSDKKIFSAFSSFYKIRDIHELIANDLISQKNKTEDYKKINFETSYLNYYPQTKNDYVSFTNDWENLVNYDFFFIIIKKSKLFTLKKKSYEK